MKLYLVQHGLAVDKATDPDRPLSDQGKADIQRMAEFLKQTNISPVSFFHSGKMRAQQTANMLAAELSKVTPKQLDGLNPNDPLISACDAIKQLDNDTMIVGHLPFMQRLTSFLLNNNEESRYVFIPGTIACLSDTENGWSMDWMIRPDLLKTRQAQK